MEQKQFTIFFDEAVHRRAKVAAYTAGKSMSRWIIDLIVAATDPSATQPGTEIDLKEAPNANG